MRALVEARTTGPNSSSGLPVPSSPGVDCTMPQRCCCWCCLPEVCLVLPFDIFVRSFPPRELRRGPAPARPPNGSGARGTGSWNQPGFQKPSQDGFRGTAAPARGSSQMAAAATGSEKVPSERCFTFPRRPLPRAASEPPTLSFLFELLWRWSLKISRR